MGLIEIEGKVTEIMLIPHHKYYLYGRNKVLELGLVTEDEQLTGKIINAFYSNETHLWRGRYKLGYIDTYGKTSVASTLYLENIIRLNDYNPGGLALVEPNLEGRLSLPDKEEK
jgi:hypothetical protein